MIAAIGLFGKIASSHSSALSDAGNWAAIIAAAVLVLGGVLAWLQRFSHALHVTQDLVALQGMDDDDERGIGVSVGVELWNTCWVPLTYVPTKFAVTLGSEDTTERPDDEASRVYLAPQQKREWRRQLQRVRPDDFPLVVTAQYQFDYGRKSPMFWRWRRSVEGSFKIEIPRLEEAKSITLLADEIEPPRDRRVPLTRWKVGPWRI